MLETLEKLKGWTSGTLNRVRVVGPFLMSQSEKMSEMWVEYQRRLGGVRLEEEAGMSEIRIQEQTRLAEVEVFKAAAVAELEGRVEMRQSLLTRLINAPPEERIDLEQKIEYLDGSARILRLVHKSTDYQTEGGTDTGKEIEGHWIDTYNDLARKRNEDWRNDLLARALAKEAEAPGSVSPRALWAIGNLDESAFELFAEVLDLCVWPVGGASAFIPASKTPVFERIAKNGKSLGVISFLLNDLGLLADSGAVKPFESGGNYLFLHGDDAVMIHAKVNFNSPGILLSPLGASIACFYERKWNDGGRAVLNDWFDSFPLDKGKITRFKWSGEIPPARNI